jgi:rhomboid family protein
MGYQDRDYYREGDGGASLTSSIVVKLIILNCVVFLADLFFSPTHELTRSLAVHGDTIAHPAYWWQFLTAGFAHSWTNIWHLAGNMLAVYVFGRDLEERNGWQEFLRFYLVAIVTGTVFWSARNYFFDPPPEVIVAGKSVALWPFALGASGGAVALTVLFCLRNPTATLLLFFILPVPAWLAGLLLVAGDLFGVPPPDGQRIAFDIHLVGAAFALAYWYFGWNFGRLPGITVFGQLGRRLGKALKSKPDLRVHDPEAHYEDLDAEGDRVLEKIKREGEGSLTKRERQVLEAYSRRMRQKLR